METWTCAPGYEPVRELFADRTRALGRGGGAFCATVGGRVVIDVWGGRADANRPWDARTTTVIMSATKGLVALCAQLLEDRGLLDVDAPVADHWPEFGQNGKERTLVRHVLLHTAGVLAFEGATDLLRADGSGWTDHDAIAAGLAKARPEWEPGSRHAYHAITYGWLVAELVRRIDGRTVGRFFAEEVAGPLGLEAWIGTPDDELDRVAHVYKTRAEDQPRLLRPLLAATDAAARDPELLCGRAFMGTGTSSTVDDLERLFTNPAVLGAELPFGGATATARALTRTLTMLAMGGEIGGTRLLSPESVQRWRRVEISQPDLLLSEVPLPRLLIDSAAAVPRTLGYLGNGPMAGVGQRFGPSATAYGVEGLGGQIAFADPDGGIAAAYVRNDLALLDPLRPALVDALYACAREQGHDVAVPAPRSIAARAGGALAEAYLRRRFG